MLGCGTVVLGIRYQHFRIPAASIFRVNYATWRRR